MLARACNSPQHSSTQLSSSSSIFSSSSPFFRLVFFAFFPAPSTFLPFASLALLAVFTASRISSHHASYSLSSISLPPSCPDFSSSASVAKERRLDKRFKTETSVRHTPMPSNTSRSLAAELDAGVSYAGVSRISGMSRVRGSDRMYANVCRPRCPLRQVAHQQHVRAIVERKNAYSPTFSCRSFLLASGALESLMCMPRR